MEGVDREITLKEVRKQLLRYLEGWTESGGS